MKHYVYVLTDTRKSEEYQFGSYSFTYEPFYVGKGKGNRWKAHAAEALRVKVGSHKDNKIRKIIAETGDLPGVEIVAQNLEESEAFELERMMIALIGRADLGKGPLTNKSDGGEGQTGFVHSEETKALLRRKSAEYVRVHGNGFAGKHHTEEAKAKKRAASIRVWSDPELRAKQSERNKGENNPNYGRKHTAEANRKNSEAKKRQYAERPDLVEASRKRALELTERLGPIAGRTSEEGKAKKAQAAKERWQDPEMRAQMISGIAKTWEVTSPEGNVLTVTNLRRFVIDRGLPLSAQSNLSNTGKWRGWKARKVE